MIQIVNSTYINQGLSGLIWFFLTYLAGYKMMKKMGEPGWISFIPLYRDYVVYGKVWNTGAFWLTLLLFVCQGFFAPLVLLIGLALLVLRVMYALNIAKSFGKGILFTLGILLLEPLFILILGFDSSTYRGNLTE